ncbi:hypothetical protein AIOL_003545 [Candidatus Rhodobacter oscarellae]|uniref:Uncharacterized protein n=1 Tax=Candidatus Rhodobacter oscarellae TaxID=1675527 RepID=A0A0J9GYK8_9RHOB|nr:hypothetical protein [Candidatus Rhodobacter lobularis]KMW58568.1 hypothetical protein AIOL_003545 [Candidatus Rhodobacter lobularis]
MATNRSTDAHRCKKPYELPPLPVIDWSLVGSTKPEVVDLGSPSASDPMPRADIAVMTWTSAEWAALDHVFVNSDKEAYASSDAFRDGWHWRSSGGSDNNSHLWGYYAMVKITPDAGGDPLRVLLFKADAHLAHPPYGAGMMKMVEVLISEAAPKRLYSIGTAGGATISEKLGDTAVTNAGKIQLKLEENKKLGIDGETVTGDWFPSTARFGDVEDKLLYKLEPLIKEPFLQNMMCEALYDNGYGDKSWIGKYDVTDMMNDAMRDLDAPKGLDKKGVPLLTTDYYFISSIDDTTGYSALEMDDAVLGLQAQKQDTAFCFVRNVSDPVVPMKTGGGEDIPQELRESWSSQIYSNFGFYTSMNGALITWAAIVAD